jgi:hypothetical protein
MVKDFIISILRYVSMVILSAAGVCFHITVISQVI